MGVLIRQPESQKNSIKSQQFFELNDDRDRSAFTLIERFLPETFFQCCNSRLHSGAVDGCNRCFTAMQIAHLYVDRLRGYLFQMFLDHLRDLSRFLVRYETA